MGGTITLIILTVLCVLFLLPLRIKASFGDGKWAVSAHYAFIRVFHKEAQPPPPPPKLPPKPNDPEQETADIPDKPDAAAYTAEHPAESTVTESHAAADDAASDQEEQQPKQSKKQKKQRKKSKKEKPEAEETPDTEADPEETEPEQSGKRKKKGFIERLKPHSLSDVMGLVGDGCAALSPSLRFLTRHLHFRHLRLYLAVGTDDAAKTAKLYGAISAATYNLLAALQCRLDIITDECRILADFFSEKITFRAALELRCSPAALLLTVLVLGIKFLWRTLCRFRREDKEAKRREQESAPLPLEA